MDEPTCRPCTNVELVRSIYLAWERGDFTSTAWAHPEIDYVFVDGPVPGSWKGVAGMEKASRDWVSAWEGWHAEAERSRELDSERVLVFIRVGGRGKLSGLEVAGVQAATVWHVCDGKVTRIVCWWDRHRALADLGLNE